MKTKIFAIYDTEEVYVRRLAEYANEKKICLFTVRSYTDIESLRAEIQTQSVEILLFHPDEYLKEMQGLYHGKLILLTDGSMPAEETDLASVYKYQSAEKILRQALSFYADEEHDFYPAARFPGTGLIRCVFSPIGRVGKTELALALAELSAQHLRTLYLNLEGYAGLEGRLSVKNAGSLSDLLYYLKKGKEGFLYKLQSLVQREGRFDYVAPALSPEDLMSVTGEEWEMLIHRLLSEAGYECLVLDLSECVRGLTELLSQCTEIWMPVLEDPVSKAKADRFSEELEIRGQKDLLMSVHRIVLPMPDGSEDYRDRVRDYTRRLIANAG